MKQFKTDFLSFDYYKKIATNSIVRSVVRIIYAKLNPITVVILST